MADSVLARLASGLHDALETGLEAVVPGFTTQGTVWDALLGTPLLIVITVVVAIVMRWLAHRLINRFVSTATSKSAARLLQAGRAGRARAEAAGLAHERHVQRTTTMGSLLRSVTTFVVFGVALLTVMSLIGLPLAPLLASAGVGGVALGFGAQSLVKDFLSGVFMIVEDQYGVGDVIDSGEVVGTVEEVSLRVTRIRDWTGVVWYVRNGEILRVGNRSQGWSTAIVDIPVTSPEDVSRALALIPLTLKGFEDVEPWSDLVLEPPSVVGVESLVAGLATIRVLTKCAPTKDVGVQREIRERILRAFEEAGLEVPAVGAPPPGP